MYSESDLDNAVEAGVVDRASIERFRRHVAVNRAAPVVDEEHFRLLTGFNDIFVGVAIALLLVSLAWIGGSIWSPIGGIAVAVASWLLAEYFTRKRRMALPSIGLLVAFVGSIGVTIVALLNELAPDASETTASLVVAAAAAAAVAGAYAHWQRFAVPVTVAAGAVAVVGTVAGLGWALLGEPRMQVLLPFVGLVGGVAVFATAMRWDLSDRERRTRCADVAFWLHLAAAPLVAHSTFALLGVLDGQIDVPTAAVVLALYIGFGIVALAVDRRALLVSGLVYVLYALYAMFERAGAVELSAAFTAFVIGSALLTLSVFWQPLRRTVVARLGSTGDRLPPLATATA